MAARADVVVENYRPDVKTRLGIDYETLNRVNPRLVYASISGFGQDGPYRDRPGVDQIAQGLSGLMSVTGEPGRGPMRVGTALADLSAGIFAAMGILVALYERQRSGRGQWVQTSLLQAQIFMLDFQAARYLMAGEVPAQAGNNHPTGCPPECSRHGWACEHRTDPGDVAALLPGDRTRRPGRLSRLRHPLGPAPQPGQLNALIERASPRP